MPKAPAPSILFLQHQLKALLRVTAAILIPVHLLTLSPVLAAAQAAAVVRSAMEVSLATTNVPVSAITPPAEALQRYEEALATSRALKQREMPAPAKDAPGAKKAGNLPEQPTDAQITYSGILREPLVPFDETFPEENAALARALSLYSERADRFDDSALTRFLLQYPESAWRVTLWSNLATYYKDAGFFTRAENALKQAWTIAPRGANLSVPQKEVLSRIVSRYAEILALQGKAAELGAFLDDIKNVELLGGAEEKLTRAKYRVEGRNRGSATPASCGVEAVTHVFQAKNEKGSLPPILRSAQERTRLSLEPAPNGSITLAQVHAVASIAGVKLVAGQREGNAAIPVPAVLHWKRGHFAAVVKRAGTMYLVRDSSIGGEMWMSAKALEEECSGYALLPGNSLPKGWMAIGSAAMASVKGKDTPEPADPEDDDTCPTPCESCKGMPEYALKRSHTAVQITDTPLTYHSTTSAPIDLTINYTSRHSNPAPTDEGLSHLGQYWTFQMLSFIDESAVYYQAGIQEDSKMFAGWQGEAKIFLPSGGIERHTVSGPQQIVDPSLNDDCLPGRQPQFEQQWRSRVQLVRTSGVTYTETSLNTCTPSNYAPSVYERRSPDGTIYIYDVTYAERVYLSQIIKPNGWVTKYVYNTSDGFRIDHIEEGRLGSPSFTSLVTFHYEDPRFHQAITRVTDAVNRSAHFSYSNSKQLLSVTDVAGITTTFEYLSSTSSVIASMTTPYGTTRFGQGGNSDGMRWVEAIDPLGARERVESYLIATPGNYPKTEALVPTGMTVKNEDLDHGNTFYWSKKVMANAPMVDNNGDGWLDPGNLDFSKAHVTNWLREPNRHWSIVSLPSSEKRPLESRIWYEYEGQQGAVDYYEKSEGGTTTPVKTQYVGTTGSAVKIGRVVDAAGTTQLRRYTYYPDGKVAQSIDPLGRETKYTYEQNPEIPETTRQLTVLTKIEQKKNTTGGYDVLSEYETYNAKNLPAKITDVAGRATDYTYNDDGKPLTVKRQRNNQDEVITYQYYPDTTSIGNRRRLEKVFGPQGVLLRTFTYDVAGRVRTITDSDNYTVTYEYDPLDRLLRITYPDGTYQAIIYAGHKLEAEWQRDRKGRWTHIEHNEGRQLVKTTDAAGRITQFDYCACGALEAITDAKNQRTEFAYDDQMRMVEKIYEGGTQSITYAYEQYSGRLDYTIDPNGNKTDYTYNIDDTTASVGYRAPNGAPIASTPTVTYTYDQFYNRVKVVSTAGVEQKFYDYVPINPADNTFGDGQLLTETMRLDGNSTDQHVITYAYDEYGREVSCSIGSVASGGVYDALGRMTSATNALGTFNYYYVGATGRLDYVDYPNSQRIRYTYYPAIASAGTGNGDFRLKQILNTEKLSNGQDGTRVISQLDYQYDVAGNILDWTQEQEDALARQNYHFGYDPADELIGATLTQLPNGNVLQEFGYKYDLAGNREVEQVGTVLANGTRDVKMTQTSYNPLNQMTGRSGGSGLATFEGTVTEPARVTIAGKQASALWKKGPQQYGFRGTAQLSVGPNTVQIQAQDGNGLTSSLNVGVEANGVGIGSMTYDNNGNLLTVDNRTYVWDAANRLISITYPDGSSTEFKYNGLGQRTRIVEKDDIGTITEDRRFVWYGMTLREERNAANQVVKRFEAQGMQHLVPGSPGLTQTYFYTRDHLGNVRDLVDSKKRSWTRASYDPWGRKQELSREHVSIGSGYRQHYFTEATKTMSVALGDKLVTYVYLDPQAAPDEIMLQWNIGGSWEQRAYWGQNKIFYGSDGTNSRRYMGAIPMPASAGWVRLEVPASQVGLEGQTVSGMSFDVYSGTAKWDHTGKVNSSGSEETTWFEDSLPAGAIPTSNWLWVASTSGEKADFGFSGHFYHQKSGLHLAYFRAFDAELGRWLNRDPLQEGGGLNLYGYVANDPINSLDPLGLCDDRCSELEKEMAKSIEELKNRYNDMLKDVDDQFWKSLSGAAQRKGGTTWEGHIERFLGEQRHLHNLIDEYQDLGCGGGLPANAEEWVYKPAPDKPTDPLGGGKRKRPRKQGGGYYSPVTPYRRMNETPLGGGVMPYVMGAVGLGIAAGIAGAIATPVLE